MSSVVWSRFVILFHLICLIATITTISYCIYVFNLNEDLCTVEYKEYYETKSDVYPRLSLCLKNPIAATILQNYSKNLKSDDYVSFLEGHYLDQEMLAMNYENLIFDLSDKVYEYQIKWRNESEQFRSVVNNTSRFWKPTHAIVWTEMFYQCYELQVPHDKRIEIFWIIMESKLFAQRNYNYTMLSLLHHPNHLLISGENIVYPSLHNSYMDDYIMRFRVHSTEVMRRRTKTSRPCYDWKNYDNQIMTKRIRSVGCRAPYHSNNSRVKLCSSKEEMKEHFRFSSLTKMHGITPPCKTMEGINFQYEEDTLNNTKFSKKEYLWIGLYFHHQEFKEIFQTRYIYI